MPRRTRANDTNDTPGTSSASDINTTLGTPDTNVTKAVVPARRGRRPRAAAQDKSEGPLTGEVVDDTDDPAVEPAVELDDDLDLTELHDAALPELDDTDDALLHEPIELEAERSRGGSLVKRDPLTAYMQEIRRYPLLTREEEHELAVRFAKSHDPVIARRLITANLRLVVKIAHEYRRAYRNLLDLVQEGNLGLLQAVQKYDPYRGVKLSSYAAWWIRAYMLKFVLNNWRLVKIGTTQAQRKLFFNLSKEREKLEASGFVPTNKLLAERLDVPEREVADMQVRLGAGDMSLDAPVGRDDEGGRTQVDMLQSNQPGPDVTTEGQEFRDMLHQKFEEFSKTLNSREQSLFRERMYTDSPLTLQELGERYGISRERARQLEARIYTRLKAYLKSELGEAVEIAMGLED